MRISYLGVAAAIAAGLAATPALAADPATLSCLNEQLPAAARDAFAVSARTLVSETPQSVSSETRAALDQAVQACAKRHKWSGAEAESARFILMSELALPELRKAAKAAGIDPDAIAAAVRDLTPEQALGLSDGNQDSVVALLTALDNHKVVLGSDAQQRVIFALCLMESRSFGERVRFTTN
ncbi:hypothetical protein OF829_16415 [Sphingomonas sp. LB-2]|uniref:hypothetical protein n=1 Tax=Sphingomonas caeni TaxID=2984949 RepID=UPI0022320FB3|nr:hypothetical protein [Sphingomonas caeni]MCW3848823.1 hypothetical protein [Sphingomonas caeni]